MDLIWKVGARAKEILVQKECPEGNLNLNKSASPNFNLSSTEEILQPTKAEEQRTEEIAGSSSDRSSPLHHDSENHVVEDVEHVRVAGFGAGDIKDVSVKAVESAKSIGSFLYGVANRTGRSITETAKHLKLTVEHNSILGEFNKEQEAFMSNQASKSNDLGLPPWIGCEDEESIKHQILSLSSDKRNFLRNPPSGVLFEFNFDEMFPVAKLMLKEDAALEKMRFELVPKLVSEENFWKNYFYRVSLLKQSSRLFSMTQMKSGIRDSSAWLCEKNLDEEWEKELQQELQEYEVVADESTDEPAWEKEMDQILHSEKVKDIV